MKEIWKDIKDYDGYYQVSNIGRIRSLPRKESPHLQAIKHVIRKDGYHWFTARRDGTPKQIRIHRAVAQSFITNEQGFDIVNHIDGDKSNNTTENLEWCTAKENVRHAHRLGLVNHVKGENHGRAKLKELDVIRIKQLLDSITLDELADIYSVSRPTIEAIKYGRTWGHVK